MERQKKFPMKILCLQNFPFPSACFFSIFMSSSTRSMGFRFSQFSRRVNKKSSLEKLMLRVNEGELCCKKWFKKSSFLWLFHGWLWWQQTENSTMESSWISTGMGGWFCKANINPVGFCGSDSSHIRPTWLNRDDVNWIFRGKKCSGNIFSTAKCGIRNAFTILYCYECQNRYVVNKKVH